jgi:dipeptidyl aminopeptidase/acylaminoacyl peptidase
MQARLSSAAGGARVSGCGWYYIIHMQWAIPPNTHVEELKMSMKFSRVSVAAMLALPLVWSAAAAEQRQVGQFILDGIPEWDPAIGERLEQYNNARSASLSDISSDGSYILISTRFGETSQLHLVDRPMGMRRQITFYDEPVGGGFVPGSNDQKLIFSKDEGGNEIAQYFLMDLKSGKVDRLTHDEGRHAGPSISRNGRVLAYTGTARNGSHWDLYLMDLKPGAEPKMVWQTEGNFYPGQFSPDGNTLLINEYISAAQTRWFKFDLKTMSATQITPEDPPAYYGSVSWSHDGQALFVTSDKDGEFRRLYRVDSERDEMICLTPDIDWDVASVAVDPTGKGIAFTTNESGLSKLYFANARGEYVREIELPVGIAGGLNFNENGGWLGITLNTPKTPSDSFVFKFPEGDLTQWTKSEVGGMDTDSFVTPEHFRYPTFDQVDGKPREIPAFIYRAPQSGPRPVLIYCHGGPESQFRPVFISIFQYLVRELGITVIAPNVRGSTGYGRSFHQLDNGRLREDSVKDVGALLDWIEQQPDLDAKRVGIYGGSYGGYMVLGSLAMYGDRFKAGIDVVGIASFVTFLENTGDFRRQLRRNEYGDESNPEMRDFLEQISPLNKAEQIKAALCVTHGKNDPRVPYTEAEQIVEKLRSLGRPAWYGLALNEGHGFSKKENRDLAREIYAAFLKKYLIEE